MHRVCRFETLQGRGVDDIDRGWSGSDWTSLLFTRRSNLGLSCNHASGFHHWTTPPLTDWTPVPRRLSHVVRPKSALDHLFESLVGHISEVRTAAARRGSCPHVHIPSLQTCHDQAGESESSRSKIKTSPFQAAITRAFYLHGHPRESGVLDS